LAVRLAKNESPRRYPCEPLFVAPDELPCASHGLREQTGPSSVPESLDATTSSASPVCASCGAGAWPRTVAGGAVFGARMWSWHPAGLAGMALNVRLLKRPGWTAQAVTAVGLGPRPCRGRSEQAARRSGSTRPLVQTSMNPSLRRRPSGGSTTTRLRRATRRGRTRRARCPRAPRHPPARVPDGAAQCGSTPGACSAPVLPPCDASLAWTGRPRQHGMDR